MEVISKTAIVNDLRWNVLRAALMNQYVRDSFSFFRGQGLEPILIKGWAIAREYPDSNFRHYSDIDLAFPSSDVHLARQVWTDRSQKGIVLDLHSELRHLDTLLWKTLYARSELIDLGGQKIRILSPEDHLRVLAVHWLTDGGWFRERLWDIFYTIENRRDHLDWDRCLNVVSSNRRRWIICVIGLTHKYLGLNIDDLPFAAEAKNLPRWLIKAVEREWASGVKLLSLYDVSSNRAELFKQIKKRIPPNPIHATVDMEGSFDAFTRIHYQVGTIMKRGIPLAKRLFKTLRSKLQ